MTKITSMKNLYTNKDYDGILNAFESNLELAMSKELVFLAFTLFDIGYFEESQEYLNESLSKGISSDEASKVYLYMGLYYYSIGKYKSSKSCFQKSISTKGLYSKESINWMKLLCLIQANVIKIHQYPYMNFYFEANLSKKDRKIFIKKYINSYNRISNFFIPKLNKKIDVFVYAGRFDIINNNLSYANPFLKTIHAYYLDEDGHELTHIIAQNMDRKIMFINRFVNEGIAECFNRVECRKFDYTYRRLDSVFHLWEDYDLFDTKYANAIGRMFFKKLLADGTRKQFICITMNQSLGNVLRTYGQLAIDTNNELIVNLNLLGLEKSLEIYD